MQVSQRGTLKPVDTTYEIVYSLEQLDISSDPEMSRKHRKLADKIAGMTWDMFDPAMLMLNYCVLLYNPDGVELDDPGEAERLQMTYASMLYK